MFVHIVVQNIFYELSLFHCGSLSITNLRGAFESTEKTNLDLGMPSAGLIPSLEAHRQVQSRLFSFM